MNKRVQRKQSSFVGPLSWVSLRASVLKLVHFAFVFLCGGTWAQEAMVRAHLETNATVWVGQKVTVVVEVLAPGYFSSAVSFDPPDPQGVLLLPPLGNPVLSSETINDTSYTVQRHELFAFPMRAGRQSIPAIPIRFSFKRASLETNVIPATVTTTAMPFAVTLPPGAEALGQVISARDLKIEEAWKPEPGRTNVPAGAAFTRTITFTAPDVPGMVFPPFPAGEIDGLGIYTKRQIRDHTERGSLQGERCDVITYVCQRPGTFTVPAARFIWFDLEAKQLRTNDLPEQTLNVMANPALATGADPTKGFAARSGRWWGFAGWIALIPAVLLAAWSTRFRHLMTRLLAPWRPVHLQTLNPTEQARHEEVMK